MVGVSWYPDSKKRSADAVARNRVYQTKRWKALRERKLKAVDYRCEVCCVVGDQHHVHHRHSIEAGGKPYPTLDGLQVLCVPCHSRSTAYERHDRARQKQDAASKHGIMMRDADGWGMSWEERQAAKRG